MASDDRCACGCPQGRHRMGRGPCVDCSRYDCERFEPTGFVEVPADESANHFPVELLDVAIEPPTAAEQPGSALPPASSLLDFYDAWRCPACFNRWFSKRRCCGTTPQPIRVEIHSREVP